MKVIHSGIEKEGIGSPPHTYPQLTADWVRSMAGFEHYSDAETEKLLQFFAKLAHQLQTTDQRGDQHEKKVLDFIRSGEYEKVVIEFKDRKMHAIILNKVQHIKKKIVDVLNENPFQKITIKSHRGKVARVETSIKIKLD